MATMQYWRTLPHTQTSKQKGCSDRIRQHQPRCVKASQLHLVKRCEKTCKHARKLNDETHILILQIIANRKLQRCSKGGGLRSLLKTEEASDNNTRTTDRCALTQLHTSSANRPNKFDTHVAGTAPSESSDGSTIGSSFRLRPLRPIQGTEGDRTTEGAGAIETESAPENSECHACRSAEDEGGGSAQSCSQTMPAALPAGTEPPLDPLDDRLDRVVKAKANASFSTDLTNSMMNCRRAPTTGTHIAFPHWWVVLDLLRDGSEAATLLKL